MAVWRQQLNDLLRFTEGRIGRAGRKCIYTGSANREVLKIDKNESYSSENQSI